MIRALAIAAVVAIGAASCGSPQRCPITSAAPVAGATPFLWRAQRADHTGPIVWLYGTIHDAGADAVPKAAWAALESSPRFASELGDVEPDRDEMRDLARIDHGPGLDSQLSTDDWYDLRDALVGVIKEDNLKRARPWYAVSLLTTHATVKTVAMDTSLAQRARAKSLPVDPLESWKVQLTALDQAVSIKDLVEAVHLRKEMTCDLSRMSTAYGAGDAAALEIMLNVGHSPVLLDARSAAWIPEIEAYFATGGAFIAVGLGHLLGDAGLVARLQRDGYVVERVAP